MKTKRTKTRGEVGSAGPIAVAGDIHAPAHDARACEWFIDLCREVQPARVVSIGDQLDLFNFSRYPRSLNVSTPADELRRGEKFLREFWGALRSACPRATFHCVGSNHLGRVHKRVLEKAPELESLVTIPGIVPGVETLTDEAEELILPGPDGRPVVFQHGSRRPGDAARFNQTSTCIGHSHVGGVTWHRNRRGMFYELNAGWLGRETRPEFAYKRSKRFNTWTLGAGLITERGPMFVPFPGASKRGRR